MSLVTVDTNILIWGIRQECIEGQEHMLDRSMALLKSVAKNHDLALTSICVSEYLALSSDEEANDELNYLQTRFKILPFDAKAAKIAAKLFRDRSQLTGNEKKSKKEIKADTQFVACAAAHRVAIVYSHDKGVRSCAKLANMMGTDVPDIAPTSGGKQKTMFDT